MLLQTGAKTSPRHYPRRPPLIPLWGGGQIRTPACVSSRKKIVESPRCRSRYRLTSVSYRNRVSAILHSSFNNRVSAIFHFSLFTFHYSLKEATPLCQPRYRLTSVSYRNRVIAIFHSSLFTLHFSLKNVTPILHSSFFILHLEHSSFLI